jgi:hypothetical protein
MSLSVVVEKSFKAVRTFRATTYDKERKLAQSFTGFLGYPMNRSLVLYIQTQDLIIAASHNHSRGTALK